MHRARLIAVAAVCGSAMLMAQAPAGPGRGAPPCRPAPDDGVRTESSAGPR